MLEKLLDIIEELSEEEAVREDLDMDLFEEGLLDSLAMAELLVAIEENFGIVLAPTEFDKNDLSSVNKIAKVLQEKGVK